MNNTIVTYIYPGAEKYISDFVSLLNTNDLEDLDVCVFNDKADINNDTFSQLKFPYKIINLKGSINEIRYKSFEILRSFDTDNIIFQDIDDLFSNDRFFILSQELSNYDLVCNDLKIMSPESLSDEPYWEARLGKCFEFDYNFIKDKNIIGLGNTAMKKKLLETETFFSNDPIAYDWFYFYQVLKLNNIKALFTSKAYTLYLQHESNIAGLKKDNTEARLKHIMRVKMNHYESLISLGFTELEPYLYQLNDKNLNFNLKESNYFWWEELN